MNCFLNCQLDNHVGTVPVTLLDPISALPKPVLIIIITGITHKSLLS
jgi:hypothetical protein